MLKHRNLIAIPPGYSIREQLEMRKMKQNEFSIRMGLSEKHVSRLISGKVELTHDVAIRLESVLGVPASFWNNLEIIYREKLARIHIEETMDNEVEILSKFPYSKMAALGWVAKSNIKSEKVLMLRQFFGVAKLEFLNDLHIPGIAYRRSSENDKSNYSLAAWAQKARIESRKLEVSKIDLLKLKLLIPKIRELTKEDPEVICQKLTEIFAICGIALVFLPHIDSTYLQGATFFDGDRIVMGITVRGKYADIFWFTLFHEIHHILSGHINISDEINIDKFEDDADSFAREVLIPEHEYSTFIDHNCFTKECISEFAKNISICPGIVVGRLQKENIIPFNQMNELKVKYQI